MAHMSSIVAPAKFIDSDDAHHIKTLTELLPYRWKHGGRDSVESFGDLLGVSRDNGLYLKVGCESWSEYCSKFFDDPAPAFDELIDGVRLLQAAGHSGPMSEEEVRRTAADKAREEARTSKQGKRNDLELGRIRTSGEPREKTNSRLLRRLARSHPDILEAYECGKFESITAAAIAAGIEKKRIKKCPNCGHQW